MSLNSLNGDDERLSRSGRNSIILNKPSVATTEVTTPEVLSPTISHSGETENIPENRQIDDKDLRHNLFGKVTGMLQRTLSGSRKPSAVSIGGRDPLDTKDPPKVHNRNEYVKRTPSPKFSAVPVRETKDVSLEYDPISKRKVLNTYEILKEIGRGEHGKVKLARDLVHDELVAIKIVNRRSKKLRPSLRMRHSSKAEANAADDYEMKIRREIAIMKKCNHKYIVKLKELLDDVHSHKIYLVLEYLEKGEIRWKKQKTSSSDVSQGEGNPDDIPCRSGFRKKSIVYTQADEDEDLLSNEYSPYLTFKQSRKIFRDVLLGLEYLHLQGIVHRDIKPANLLVRSDNVVKISDFGVSFASSLENNEDKYLVNEVELAKTAGTPAFFAPELCETNFSSTTSSKSVSASSLEVLNNEQLTLTKILPKIDYKIDIWALGVTLYCLLFGKVPFNAESEYELFQVIVNQKLEFPNDRNSFNSPAKVSESEFELAKDLLSKMLDKDRRTRIEIKDIKNHPFVLLDLENDNDSLNELLHLNDQVTTFANISSEDNEEYDDKISKEEIENAVVGIGSRIKSGVVKAIRAGGRDFDSRKTFAHHLEPSGVSSSDESSYGNSRYNSSSGLNESSGNSVILSEAFQISTPPKSRSNSHQPDHFYNNHSYVPSNLSTEQHVHPQPSSHSTNSTKDGKTQNILLQDVIDSHSNSSSRRGSSAGTEAVQIETKRNVGGDLYLKNQSIVDTFKGIQQKDNKRRKSSAYSVPYSRAKDSVSSQPGHEDSPFSMTDKAKQHAVPLINQLKVGPISIDNDRRPSSVISLPLNESFASLDSFDDDYLKFKYQELTNNNQDNKYLMRQSDVTQSDPNLSRNPDTLMSNFDNINEKFKKFDLNSSMKSTGVTINLNGDQVNDHEGIAPKTISKVPSNLSGLSSSQSCSSSDSSQSGSESDEEGNLTLAFSSKVAPLSKPKFLSLSNRAKSHDSHLPGIVNTVQQHDTPVIFQDDIPEFEDVPASLISSVPRSSVSTDALMQPVISVVSSNGSSTTITAETLANNSNPEISRRENNNPSKLKYEQHALLNKNKHHESLDANRIPSPIVNEYSSSSKATPDSYLARQIFKNHKDNYFNNYYNNQTNNQFNNHYKKDPIYYPFPNALHYDNDKESEAKSNTNLDTVRRPSYYRSNSVTVGLLQHNKDEINQE